MIFKQALLRASLMLSVGFLVVPFQIATAAALDAGNDSEVRDNVVKTKPETGATIPADVEAKSPLSRMWGSQSTVVDLSIPQPQDFWRDAIALGKDLQANVTSQLDKLALGFPDITTRVHEFRETISQVVASAATIREAVLNEIRNKGDDVTFDKVKEELDGALQLILDGMHDEFPPPDQAPTHTQRNETVYKLLNKGEDALIKVAIKYSTNANETHLREQFDVLKSHVASLIILIGDLIEQHPVIAEYLAFSCVAMIIPEAWILRPLFRLFGLGPLGPTKGGLAAAIQRRFYGAVIPEGSLFSLLQSMTMKPLTSILKAIFGTVSAWIFRHARYMFGWKSDLVAPLLDAY